MKRVSQTEKIRQLLIENTGVPVPAFKLAAISLQYNARVFELRAEGFEIINTTHHRADGSVWSSQPTPLRILMVSPRTTIATSLCFAAATASAKPFVESPARSHPLA